MDWEAGGTLAAWVSIVAGFIVYIYRRGKTDATVNVRLKQLEEDQIDENHFVTEKRCKEIQETHKSNIKTTTVSFEDQLHLIYDRLSAMDDKRDDAVSGRNRRFEGLENNVTRIKDKLTDELSEVKESLASVDASVSGLQDSFTILLTNHLEK